MSLLRVNTIRNKEGNGNPDFDRGLSVSTGISTLGTVKISSGVITATSGVVTYYGDGSNLSGVNNFIITNQGITTNPIYPTFAVNTGLTTIGIARTQVAYIPSSGNLGIGTTNPTSRIDVFGGNIRAFGTTAPSFIVTPTSGSSYIFGANTFITGAGIYDNTAADWRLVVRNTTGNILIGSTTDTGTASQRLQVNGGGYFNNSVGIGTTNPDHLLSINGTSNQLQVSGFQARVRVNRPSASGTNAIDFQTNGVYDWSVGSVSAGSSDLIVRWRSTDTDYVTIKTNGDVGIGVTNPQGTLQVGTGVTIFGNTGIISATEYYGNLTGTATTATSSTTSSKTSAIAISPQISSSDTHYLTYSSSTNSSSATVKVDNRANYLTYTPNSGTFFVRNVSVASSLTAPNVTVNTNLKLEGTGNSSGDFSVGISTAAGVILTSENGTKYRLIVSNSGVLTTVVVP